MTYTSIGDRLGVMNSELDKQIDENQVTRETPIQPDSPVIIGPRGQEQMAESQQRNKPWSEYLSDLGSAVWDASVEKQLYNFYELSSAGNDPTFIPKEHPELYKGLDPLEHPAMDAMGSMTMATRFKDQLQEQQKASQILRASGVNGPVAGFIGSLIDPPKLALMLAQPEMGLTKFIPGAGVLPGMARGAVAGAVGGAEFGVLDTVLRPTGQWSDVLDASISGGIFGTVLGSVGVFPDPSLKHVQDNLNTWSKVVHDNPEFEVNKNVSNPSWKPVRTVDTEGSIGAVYVPVAGEVFNADGVTPDTLTRRQNARAFLAENNLGVKYEDAFNQSAFGTGDKAKALYDMYSKSPMAAQFERMWTSGSLIAREYAYKLMENGVGAVRNNASGIMMKEVDHVGMLQGISHPTEGYTASLNTWIKEQHPEVHPIRSALHQLSPDLVSAFHKEVLLARNAKRLGKIQEYEELCSGPAARLNRQLDKDMLHAATVMKETGVFGASRLKPEDSIGYFGQHIHADKLNELMNVPKRGLLDKITGKPAATRAVLKYAAVVKTLTDSYLSVYPTWSREAAETLAKAQMRRAKSFAEGIDMNMYRMLNDNGELFLKKYLTDNLGVTEAMSTKLIDGLKNVDPDSQKVGFLRSARHMDWSTPIGDSGYQLIDILHTDIPQTVLHYTNKASGMTALARVGLQYGDVENLINSIKEELLAAGTNHRLPDDDLRNMFQPFIGGPIYGAPPEAVRKALSAASLALYGGMGIAQATETAAGMVAFGMKEFTSAIQTEMRGLDQASVRQVEHLVAGVRGEERLYLENYQHNSFMHDAPAMQEMNSFLNKALSAGRQIQGIITGFYYVRQIQQKAGIRCMLHALVDTFDGIQTMNPARLADIGVDEASRARLERYFTGDTKVVSRYTDANGIRGVDLGLEHWDPKDVMELGVILNRSVNQVVQKAMLGEKIPWMSKVVGSIMMQGKGFTVLSMTKQFLRSYRLGDEAVTMGVLYGTALGAGGYVANKVISGATEDLGPVDIIKGGISNSNMTAFAPMLWDTPMSLLGLNSMKLNNYSYNPRTDVLGVPPMLTVLNAQLHLPAVPLHVMTGTVSGSDRTALKSLPLIGNHPFFKALWNTVGSE